MVEEESEELPVLLSDFLVELFAGLSFEEHSVDFMFQVGGISNDNTAKTVRDDDTGTIFKNSTG